MNKKPDHWLVFRWMEDIFTFPSLSSLSPPLNIQNQRNPVLSEHAQGLRIRLFSWESAIPTAERDASNFSKTSNLFSGIQKSF